MRKFFALCLSFVCVSLNLLAQEVITRTIVIDTVRLDTAVDPADLRVFSIFDVRPDQIISITQDSLFRTGDKPIICRIRFEKGTDLMAYMMLDDKGGHIELHYLETSPDTLRIPVWHIYKNRLIDGVSRTVLYYHHIGDSLVKKPFAEKHWQTPPIYIHQDTIRNAAFVMNGRDFMVPLSVAQPHSIVKVVDGYLSKLDEHRERKLYTSPEGKRRKPKYNKYSTTIKTTFHSYSAYLDLRK